MGMGRGKAKLRICFALLKKKKSGGARRHVGIKKGSAGDLIHTV